MRLITFGIQDEEEARREFIAAYEAARLGKPFSPKEGVNFTSIEAARNFLSPARLALLRLIKEKDPRSLYALAKLSGRSFPSVFKDIEILRKHGLVKLTRDKQSRRRSVLPRVEYDAIHLWIGV
ncbi:MAG: MarR family transcriptional regulator [Elusimicrobia bacterium]|nr:MarR family transcriptional regulator [Elusimicrobiota bacterium]